MKFEIKHSPSFYIVGKFISLNLLKYNVTPLWSSFMPNRHLITNTSDENLYSLSIYPEGYFHNFSPTTNFIKWAGKRVNTIHDVPTGMDILLVQEGLYMVFNYKGSSEKAGEFFNMVYSKCIPESDYTLDNRPHFEILGAKYKNNSDDSEEEIWIPVKPKT